MTRQYDTAEALVAAGCSVVPVAADGTKMPALPWKPFQARRATSAELRRWFPPGSPHGVGIVCGAVSGGLEMLELEGRAVAEGLLVDLAALAQDSGLGDLWSTVTAGYTEQTPTGGLHVLYRVTGAAVPGNTVLARRPATAAELAEHPNAPTKVLVETRGEGGFVVVAPSDGTVHPNGRAWTILRGGPSTIATVTAEQHAALHALARAFDAVLPAEPEPLATPAARRRGVGLSPGDDYNARARWDDILGPAGWTVVRRAGPVTYWRRPGKATGVSATTGRTPEDRLYVFSSSTPFPVERCLSKFAALAVLDHGGDFKAAAKALRSAGYGSPRRLTAVTSAGPAATADTTAGTVAVALQPQPVDPPVSLTDAGNADLLVAHAGHRYRYVPEHGSWLAWTGQQWAPTPDDGPVVQAALDVIQRIEPGGDEAVGKHRARSLSRRALESAVILARTDPRIRVRAADLDADPWMLNTPAGTVDLRTGTLHPHTATDLHTRITGAGYDPDAPCPRWDAFLAETFPDPIIRGYVQRLAGYSAAGIVLHHILIFLAGAGANGKSVLLDVLRAVLGDYAATAPGGFLLAGRDDDNSAIARLAGVRMVVCSEIDPAARFAEARIKMLTGGDQLTARHLYKSYFSFTPSHTLWLAANHQPRVTAGGDAFWRRLRLLHLERVVPEEERIENLAAQLVETEGAGILAWMVRGCQDVVRDGLSDPETVLAATKEYATEEDVMARFVTDRLRITGHREPRLNTRDMRSAYAAWCRAEGEEEALPHVFARELRTRFGVPVAASHGQRYYLGVSLVGGEGSEEAHPTHWTDR